MLVRVFVGFLESLWTPVRASERPDLAGGVVFVEDLDDRADGHFRVVSMQHVDIEKVCAQAGEGIVDV